MKNIELLHQLIETAGVLGENSTPLELTNPKIRTILSPALRVWSEPNGIFLVQKMLNRKIYFKCREHKLTIRACEGKQLVEWASPVMLNGIEMDVWLESETTSNSISPKIDDRNAIVNLHSGAFFDQKLMYLRGVFLTRKEIINYVANRMGGTHPVPAEEKSDDKKFKEFRRLLGLAENGSSIKILKGSDLDRPRVHQENGTVGGDPFLLYVADAATRFVEGINAMLPVLEQKLADLKTQISKT